MTKTTLQPLKGFRDFLPKDARKRSYATAKIKEVFEQFGFEPLETPALEYKDLLLGKYGEEADKLVYTFQDRGGRDVALRYDQTVPTARILAMYNQQLAMPWRRYQVQPVWRAENTQKGRYREFLQFDGDIFGTTSPLADAELISLVYTIYKNLGFEGIEIFINDRKILFDCLEFVNIPKDLTFSVIQSIDKLDKKSKEEVSKELIQKGIDEKTVEHLFTHLESAQLTDHLSAVISHAKTLGVPKENIIFQPGLARGLDYYTSTIFELKIKGYDGGSLLGGGRYDKLIDVLSGIDIPAVGFAIGFDRTIDAMEEFKLFPPDSNTLNVLVCVFSDETIESSLSLLSYLRKENVQAELFPASNTKLEKQLKYADKKGISWMAVIGPEEQKKKTIIIKNLKTGHQEEVTYDNILSKLKN
jgi:histidyl-tRNA synthetase